MLHPGTGRVAPADDPVAVIRESNRAYLEAYGRNARLMALLAQVSTLAPRFRALEASGLEPSSRPRGLPKAWLD